MSFPTAAKVVVKHEPTFELKDEHGTSLGLFIKIKAKQAIDDARAVRATLGDKVCWFLLSIAPHEIGTIVQ